MKDMSPIDIMRAKQEHSKRIEEMVNKYGHAVQGVFGTEDEPDFVGYSYTVGASLIDAKCEFIISGNISMQLQQQLLNNAVGTVFNYADNPAGVMDTDIATVPFWILPCIDKVYDITGVANEFLKGKKFPIYQIVWPDEFGKFPWDNEWAMHGKELKQELFCLPPQGIIV